MLGLFDWTPKFIRRYADLRVAIETGMAGYAEDVRATRFPGVGETYSFGAK
jgi:3-methyl-2-oxobutanoate hydroxymethyltransferase